MLDIIYNVFPFPFRFFAKAKLQLQCFVVQVHLQKVIETHIFFNENKRLFKVLPTYLRF